MALNDRSPGEVASRKTYLSYHKNIIECELEVPVGHKVEIFSDFLHQNFTLDTLECIKMMKKIQAFAFNPQVPKQQKKYFYLEEETQQLKTTQ